MEIRRFFTGPLQVNTYISHDDTGLGFIVDPGGFSAQAASYISEQKIDLQYIILTHGHADHIGGVKGFKDKFPNAKVIASVHEKELLQDGHLNSSIMICGEEVTVDADIYVEDGDELTVGNTHLSFLHTPGHSPGGMCIIATEGEGQVCYSGDTLFFLSIGRTDFYGGDMDVLCRSIREKLYVLPDDTIVLPGHMQETLIGNEKRNNPFVQDTGKRL